MRTNDYGRHLTADQRRPIGASEIRRYLEIRRSGAMHFDKMRVSVPDATVIIGDVALVCQLPVDGNIVNIRWDQSRYPRGRMLTHDSGEVTFDDREKLAPYIAAWLVAASEDEKRRARERDAEERREAEKAERQAEMQRRVDEALAARAAYERDQADRATTVEALQRLSGTDHEVIKALEAWLAAEGRLPANLVADRAAARQVVKTERARRSKTET